MMVAWTGYEGKSNSSFYYDRLLKKEVEVKLLSFWHELLDEFIEMDKTKSCLNMLNLRWLPLKW
jgi:hypothetical protein